MPLFEVVILENPKKKKNLERLVLGPTSVIAKDMESAAISVIMDNTNIKIDKKRMEVKIRPFM